MTVAAIAAAVLVALGSVAYVALGFGAIQGEQELVDAAQGQRTAFLPEQTRFLFWCAAEIQVLAICGLLFGSLSRGTRSSLVHVLAFVIDRRFVAPGVITLFEPLHVALQLIRFGAFFCHAYSLTRT